jgi:hypothetical protein
VEHNSAHRALPRSRVRTSAPVLTLLHSDFSRQIVYAHPVSQAAFDTPKKKSAAR